MDFNRDFYSCDDIRRETLATLEDIGPGIEAMIKLDSYYSRVDDRTTTNNYAELVRAKTQGCNKLVNPKFWVPIHASVTDNLLSQLDFGWTRKAAAPRNIFGGMDDVPPPVPLNGDLAQPPNKKSSCTMASESSELEDPIFSDERMKNIDKKLAEVILNEVVDRKQAISWDDIAGLEDVKQAINEIVVYPMLNPSLFQGLLSPDKGLLLFGPPGTGKTLIGKCIASESGATFFALSASSFSSKWAGESEKLVRALFAIARCKQPSVVFIDEIDSILTQRQGSEQDWVRKVKTEFLVQFDGVTCSTDDRLLVVGATNRPQELDEAARRRFTKRLYVPLPDHKGREQIIRNLMKKAKSSLSDTCVSTISRLAKGFSGADMSTLCKEAALVSLRKAIKERGNVKALTGNDIPPTSLADFETALSKVKASVGINDLLIYEQFNSEYGASQLV